MQLSITVYLSMLPSDAYELLKMIQGKINGEKGRATIAFEDLNVRDRSLGFKAWFMPISNPEVKGSILAIGAGIDATANVIPHTALEVKIPSEQLETLQPIWGRIFKWIVKEKEYIRSFSGDIDPIVFETHPRPGPNDSLDKWFEWGEESELKSGNKLPDKEIANVTGHTAHYIKTARYRWRKKRSSK